jgi:Flp pilus assembly protein TadD
MYLPLIAVLSVSVAGAIRLVRQLPVNGNRGAFFVTGASAILVAATLTIARNETFRSPLDLWVDASKKRPTNARAIHNLACALAEADHIEEAIDAERRAVELTPFYPQSVRQLAAWYDSLEMPDAAEQAYRRALKLHPDHPGLLLDYAERLATKNRRDEAEPLLLRALAIAPQNPAVQRRAGRLLETKPPDAVR